MYTFSCARDIFYPLRLILIAVIEAKYKLMHNKGDGYIPRVIVAVHSWKGGGVQGWHTCLD